MSIDVLVQESSDRSRSMAYSLPYGWVVHVLLLVTAADAAAWRWAPPTRRGPPMEKFGAGAPARRQAPAPRPRLTSHHRPRTRSKAAVERGGLPGFLSLWWRWGWPRSGPVRGGCRAVTRPHRPGVPAGVVGRSSSCRGPENRARNGGMRTAGERERWTPARGGTTPGEGGTARSSRFLFLCKARRHRGGRGRAFVVTIHCGMDPNSPPHL